MTTKRLTLPAALICLTALGTLTGCGDGSDTAHAKAGARPAVRASASASAVSTTKAPAAATPEPFAGQTGVQIFLVAVDTMKKLQSVTVDRTSTKGGKTIRLNSAMDDQGHCVAHVVINGTDMRLIKIGSTGYVQGNKAFWQSQPVPGSDVGGLSDGRWVKMPAAFTTDHAIMTYCDLDTWVQASLSGSGDGMTRGRQTTVDGHPVVSIGGPEADGATVTLYVAADGIPYIRKTVELDGKDRQTFTDFDKPVHAVAPHGATSLDLH
ncbi:hypothetical protein [Streptomyces sp. CA-111067]|uniref:hypothetical protein n=1 Tax=Streptomyces sp. CA-111067 TaxID=3240046 RepID=UPI003D977629